MLLRYRDEKNSSLCQVFSFIIIINYLFSSELIWPNLFFWGKNRQYVNMLDKQEDEGRTVLSRAEVPLGIILR